MHDEIEMHAEKETIHRPLECSARDLRRSNTTIQKNTTASTNGAANVVPAEAGKRTSFLDLPAELRRMIYTYSFKNKHSYQFDIDEEEPLQYLCLPPLTRVSRQIRSESIPIFFETTEFAVWIGCDARERECILAHGEDSDISSHNRHCLNESKRLSQLCGRPGVCDSAAEQLRFLQKSVTIRNIKFNIVRADSMQSLQTWLPERMRWMRKNRRLSPTPVTMWETTLQVKKGALHIEITSRAFPALKERDLDSLRAAARESDRLRGRPEWDPTPIFDAPDDVIAIIMEDVKAAAKEIAAKREFRGFTLINLQAIGRKYRIAGSVMERVRHFVDKKGVRVSRPAWQRSKGRSKRHVDRARGFDRLERREFKEMLARIRAS